METEIISYVDNNGNSFEAESLKPCPFCGGQPELLFVGNNFTKVRKVLIQCTHVLCRIKRTSKTIKHNHEWCAKEAIFSWNKRVE